MRYRVWAMCVGLGLCWASACAFPTIEFVGSNDDDGTGATGGNGGAAGSMTGNGGFGGAEDCVVGEEGACDAGQKCSVISPDTGATGCVPAGLQEPWTRCFSDTDCSNGDWCDVITKVCHPVCQSSAQCTEAGANCVPARTASGSDIPGGLKICTPNCHPMTAAPCNQANGQVSCYYDVSLSLWDCTQTDGHAVGESCMGNDDCSIGLACPTSNTCRTWCNTPNDWCVLFVSICVPTDPVVLHNGQPYGLCE